MEVPSHRHSRVVSSVLCAERGLKKKPISSSQHASIVKCLSGTFESKGRQLATYQITHALVAKWIYLFRHPIQSSHQLNQCTDHFTCWTPEYPINWEKIISFERKQVGRGLRFNDGHYWNHLIWLGVTSVVELHLNVPPCFLFPVRLIFIETSWLSELE